jgi:hypothetical protein
MSSGTLMLSLTVILLSYQWVPSEVSVWTKTAEEILESLSRYCARISGAGD